MVLFCMVRLREPIGLESPDWLGEPPGLTEFIGSESLLAREPIVLKNTGIGLEPTGLANLLDYRDYWLRAPSGFEGLRA